VSGVAGVGLVGDAEEEDARAPVTGRPRLLRASVMRRTAWDAIEALIWSADSTRRSTVPDWRRTCQER
jgi:hypothetical protein